MNKEKSSILFKKEAIGLGGSRITVYKIKTMIEHDFSKEFELSRDGLGKYVDNPYIIPQRAWMRKYWIDELPQVYNICNGDMSLVGVRPRTQQERDSPIYKDIYSRAIQQKPGFIGVPYVFAHLFKDKDVKISIEKLDKYYLDSCDRNGKFVTDLIYGFMVIKNIIFRGVRSK